MIWLVWVLGTAAMAQESEPDGADEGGVVEVVYRKPWGSRTRTAGTDKSPGAWTLGGGDLEQVAGAGGDLGRGLQALPVVHTATVRSTALSIAGADPSETVWVVDGVALQAPRSSGTVFSRVPTAIVDSVTVYPLAMPPHLSQAVGGLVSVQVVQPADDELDGTIELSPIMGQAMVSTPIGPRDKGNAVMVSARRSWLEPIFAGMDLVGRDPGWRYATEDAAMKLRLKPAQSHKIDLTGLVGRTRVDGTLVDGADLRPTDNTHTALAVLRHRWALGSRVRLNHMLGFTHEGQVAHQALEDRDDVRHRAMYRARVHIDLSDDAELEAGFEVARFSLASQGLVQDPAVKPDWLQVPWRQFEPPLLNVQANPSWIASSQWFRLVAQEQFMEISASLRLEQVGVDPWARPTWSPAKTVSISPQASLFFLNEAGGRLGFAAGLVSQLPRDPIVLQQRPLDLQPAAATYVLVSLQQPLGKGASIRADMYHRRHENLPEYPTGGAGPPLPEGSGRTTGVDLAFAMRHGRLNLSAAASVRSVTRSIGPTFNGELLSSYEPWFARPTSLQGSVGARLGTARRWRPTIRGQIRSGVDQPDLTIGQTGGTPEHFLSVGPEFTRLGPNWRLAGRVEREIILKDSVQLSLWAEVLASGGPLWMGADPPLAGMPPVLAMRRDRNLLPWLGARARF